MKLTVDQLKNYLGTGLKIQHPYSDKFNFILSEEIFKGILVSVDYVLLHSAKPIMYRISDLDKEIEINGDFFVPIIKLKSLYNFRRSDYHFLNQFKGATTTYRIMINLFQWHFWPFGDEYFNEGLIIDKLKQTI